MIIVQVIGGTASQMSAFSRGYTLAKMLGKELVLDISDYHNGYKFPYALDAFNVNVRKLTYTHKSSSTISSAVVSDAFISDFSPHFIQTNNLTFDETLKETSSSASACIYLVGEGAPVFEYISELREIFTPRRKSIYINKFKTLINSSISVAVHIRQTDFVSLNWNNSFDYYIAAINYMKLKYPNAVFYFFSDDLEAVKQQFGNQEEYRYVNLFGGADTDIDELLCMSMCTHRILTGRSGYSIWCAHLSNSENAINIVHNPNGSSNDKFFQSFTDDDIHQYLNNNFIKLETKQMSNITKAKTDILTLIENQNYDEAMTLISSVGFDSMNLTPTDKDEFFSYCELIYSAQENFLSAEQSLIRHMQFAENTIDTNYNMSIVKWSLGKKLSSYIYAAKSCNLSLDQGLLDEFKAIFSNDAEYKLFEVLLNCPKMHFIICPITNFHFYMKHSVSLAILLKRMGHEVSFINSPIEEGFNPDAPIDILVKYSLCYPTSPDLCYNYDIKGYNYFKTANFSSYISLVETLINQSNLPCIVIGRDPLVFQHLNYNKLIYWDFSCKLDIDSLIMLTNNNINDIDTICSKNANKVITTDTNRFSYLSKIISNENVLLSNSYTDSGYSFIDETVPFTSNFIDNENFIRFAIDIIKLSQELL